MTPTSEQAVGRTLDGFRLLEVLGRGGMGVVHKAEDIELSRLVAIKMIDQGLAQDAVFMQRFRSEARALARTDSPYIVRVHALRATDAGLFIVMEYVDGGTLHDLPKPYPWQQALPLLRQSLIALENAHGAGIVHRDIKPRNIMLSKNGTVKVTDFGLARLTEGEVTRTGSQGIAGTLYYMSPEQVMGLASLDHRSDLYSMGMTLFELLTGGVPFDKSASEFTVMQAIVDGKLPPPSLHLPDLPPELDAIVMKALQKDPDQRYQSAAEMLADVERFEAATTGTAPAVPGATVSITAPLASPPKPVPSRRLLWNIAAATILLAGVAGGVWTWPWTSEGDGGLTENSVIATPPPADAAILSVTSDPAGAAVLLNGKPMGVTPGTGLSVAPGAVHLRLSKEGYLDADTNISLAASQALDLAFTLKEELAPPPPAGNGWITMRTPHSGVMKISGRTVEPGERVMVPADQRLWVACGEGELSSAVQVSVPRDQQREFTCYFTATISVQTEADDGSTPWATVVVDGRPTDGFTPHTFEVGPGTYRVGVQRNGYEAAGDRSVTVKPGFRQQSIPVVISLKRHAQ